MTEEGGAMAKALDPTSVIFRASKYNFRLRRRRPNDPTTPSHHQFSIRSELEYPREGISHDE